MKSSPTKGEFNRGFRLAFPFPVLFIWPGERKDGNCLAKFSSYGQAITGYAIYRGFRLAFPFPVLFIWPGDLPGQDYQQRRKNIVPVLGIRASNQKMKNPKAGSN